MAPAALTPPRTTALIHDWLYVYGGAERVLEQMLGCYPQADLFSLIDFLPPDQRGFIHNKPSLWLMNASSSLGRSAM